MATKDPNRLFDLLDALRTNMESIIEDAKALATEAGGFNGELNKVIKEQVTKYLVPAIEKLINDDKTPGSIIGLERFLGSVPLAMVREQPTEADVPSDIMPDEVKLANPVGTTGDAQIDAIPQGASYRNPAGTGIKEAQEGKETKFDGGAWKTQGDSKEPMETAEIDYKMQDVHSDDSNYLQEKFQVVRTSKIGSALPDGKTGLKEQVIADFDTKEEAEEYAESLNKTITEGEKDLLGTEYKVTGCESCGKVKEAAVGRSMKDVLDAEIAARDGKEPIRESGRTMKEVLDEMLAEDEAGYGPAHESLKKNN